LFLIPGTAVRAKQGAYGVEQEGKVMFVGGHEIDGGNRMGGGGRWSGWSFAYLTAQFLDLFGRN
jgi:hypothetical protein